MQHRPQSTYRSSGLARTKVKQNKFFALCSRIFMQPSEVGLVEDRANSTTIIRIIVGLLLVHLIIIGGIILHGKVDNTIPTEASALAAPPIAPPAPAPAVATNTLPQVAPTPTPGPTANPPQHITQAPGTSATQGQALTTTATANTTPTVAPVVPKEDKADKPAQLPAYKTIQIKPGDTLYRIAQNNNVSEAAILELNADIIKDPNKLVSGIKIRIPVAPDSAEGKQVAAQREAERIEAEGLPYKVQKGDTLGGISKRFGVSIKEIQKLNNMKDDKLQIGQTLKIPATEKAKKKLLKK